MACWVAGGKFGDRRCRDGAQCANRTCGFAHPTDWIHCKASQPSSAEPSVVPGSNDAFALVTRGETEALRSMLATDPSQATATKTSGMYATWSPLHTAAMGGKAEETKLLLAARAAPDATTKKGDTALHMAARKAHGSVVEALMAAGADATIANSSGLTALEAARGAVTDSALLAAVGAALSAPREELAAAEPSSAPATSATPATEWAAAAAYGGPGSGESNGQGLRKGAAEFVPSWAPNVEGQPWIRCSEKFGDRRCREANECRNAKCGFAHPATWVHFHGEHGSQDSQAAPQPAAEEGLADAMGPTDEEMAWMEQCMAGQHISSGGGASGGGEEGEFEDSEALDEQQLAWLEMHMLEEGGM